MNRHKHIRAFTLIELSIVLVIIGLIVGGILVGRDLIAAAAVRSQISQIDRYTQAINTFKGKYGYLPGDIKDPEATNFGFQPRGAFKGEGDGDGEIWGISSNTSTGSCNICSHNGEQAMFWVDMASVQLTDDGLKTATPTGVNSTIASTGLKLYLPQAKLGSASYLYVYLQNYIGLSGLQNIAGNALMTVVNLTVNQAYTIDKKIDDGMPQSGKVITQYNHFAAPYWAIGSGTPAAPGSPQAASSLTCGDNGNNGSVAMNYSILQNNGTGMNCALSFQFQ